MTPRGIQPLFACVAFFSLIAVPGTASAQARVPVRRELVWSLTENETEAPHFTDDGAFVVLVSRVHWPDGAEAEELPEAFFERLHERLRKEPRFADPIIRLIDLNGKQVCEVRYGSNPSVSPDGRSIAFSRQKRPISGLRALAETLAGNDIQVFDCEKKEAKTVAEPDTGYLDDPLFSPDGKSIIYTTNEAVNGSMGGSVGLERVDLVGAKKEILLAKETVPAVPCPPAGPAKSAREALLCSQGVKLTSAFPGLLLDFAMAAGQLVVLQARPLPSAGDMYLAAHYAISIKLVLPERNDILSLGPVPMEALDASLQSASDGRVLVFWQYWRPLSLRTKEWLPDLGPQNANRRSTYSPDLKYYLAAEPKGFPNHFTLYQSGDGMKLAILPRMANVYGATWSRDSKRFALVGVPRGASGSQYREELLVYSIQ
jgi:hypothetical protein